MNTNSLTVKQLNYMMDLIDQSIELACKQGSDNQDITLITTKLSIVKDILERDVIKTERLNERKTS